MLSSIVNSACNAILGTGPSALPGLSLGGTLTTDTQVQGLFGQALTHNMAPKPISTPKIETPRIDPGKVHTPGVVDLSKVRWPSRNPAQVAQNTAEGVANAGAENWVGAGANSWQFGKDTVEYMNAAMDAEVAFQESAVEADCSHFGHLRWQ